MAKSAERPQPGPLVQVTLNGEAVPVPKGTVVGDLLKERGLSMPCAGMGRCGKCRVRATGALGEPTAAEREKLSPQELEEHLRLACQTVILGPCQVEWEQAAGMTVQLGGKAALGKEPLFSQLGVALDLGTTTLAAQLYGREGLLAQAGCGNPQEPYGADVISRIQRALAGEGEALQKAVCQGISQLVCSLAEQADVPVEQIDTVVVTGNTSMLYLLTGRDPQCLSHAPFQADWLAGDSLPAAALGLPCPEAQVVFPPCVSAFVGADITCAMLQAGLGESPQPELLVDIGTNGEIALSAGGKLLCCSTAAGPAFEGAGLSCGMPGTQGAIYQVTLREGVLCSKVLGGGPAKGICGSGVVDAVSCLLQSGQLDETGYLEEPALLAEGVALQQEDIRKVQLAKGAIWAGIQTMLHHGGLPLKELSRLYVAGGFGSSLNMENAMAMGLLPPLETEKVKICGNAALDGTAGLLLDKTLWGKACQLARRACTLELSADSCFKESYMEGMLFPEDGDSGKGAGS